MDTSKAPQQITNTIPLAAVESSQIKAVGFDGGTNTLAIQFHGKAGEDAPTYHYFNVPAEVNKAMVAEVTKEGGSVGGYFYKAIKGKYDYQRIEPTTGDRKTIPANTEQEGEKQAAA